MYVYIYIYIYIYMYICIYNIHTHLMHTRQQPSEKPRLEGSKMEDRGPLFPGHPGPGYINISKLYIYIYIYIYIAINIYIHMINDKQIHEHVCLLSFSKMEDRGPLFPGHPGPGYINYKSIVYIYIYIHNAIHIHTNMINEKQIYEYVCLLSFSKMKDRSPLFPG